MKRLLPLSLFFSILTLSLMISCMSVTEWFTQDSLSMPESDPKYFNGPKGGLTHSKDFKLLESSGDSWKSLWNNCSDGEYGKGLCDELGDFYHFGVIFIAIESCAIVSLSFSIILTICFLLKLKITSKIPLALVGLTSFFTCILHTIGFIIWADGISFTLNSCEAVPFEKTYTANVCTSTGANIAVSAIPFSIISPLCLMAITIKPKPKRGRKEIALVNHQSS